MTITIDKDAKTISFVDAWDHHHKEIQPPKVLPLVSGFVCACGTILRAYFETGGEKFLVQPYEGYPYSTYNRQFIEFWTPCRSGGGVTAKGHGRYSSSSRCDYQVFTGHTLDVSTQQLVGTFGFGVKFEEWMPLAIRAGVLPGGLILIPDLMDHDDPLLGFSTKEAFKPQGEGESYMEFTNRRDKQHGKWVDDWRDHAIMAGVPVVKVELPPDEDGQF